ncbi:acyl-CoA carboxylase subunit beta [Modestobacter excelsi]|uniref:acyl-CoA carboxylase subunit beta n=1 Tax=Modestobacter excelsi TaxID=2213161 RepID=UPI001C20CFD3|nr:carboxyl transferase domain-containing protein [Modestobacter excelsi]
MRALVSELDTRGEMFRENREFMLDRLEGLQELLDQAALGGGVKAQQRHAARGKLSIRERISLVLDPGAPFLEISPLAAWESPYAIGGGFVVGIGVIAGVECVICGNDPTVVGGALQPYSTKKWMRALEIARANRIPYVSFVESAGADLRRGGGADPGSEIRTSHFAETGRYFHDMAQLSKSGIPTICVVFGSATAGGAYQPGMSDYTILIEGKSKAFLAGPPLVKMATGEESDDETLGGARMHAEVSGLADYLAKDEPDAIRMCREVVSHLNWRKQGPAPIAQAEAPRSDPEELLGLFGEGLATPVEVRDVIARIADGSRFEEFKREYGSTLVCGWATIHGYRVGILGNNGVILPDSASKGAQFIQLCNQVDVPLVFLQNLTGFMVGRDFERDGIIKKGSQLVNAVSTSAVPHVTVIIGASYGAGTYGMSGRSFGNRFTFLWPSARIGVMGPKQIAGVMSIVRREQAARAGRPFDEDEDRQLVAAAEARQERASLALEATGAVSDDGIIDPRDTRDVIGMCLSVSANAAVEGTRTYGVFRL